MGIVVPVEHLKLAELAELAKPAELRFILP